MRKALLILTMMLLAGSILTADTFMIVMQERKNGDAAPYPLAGREGLLSSLFESGLILFDMEIQSDNPVWHLSENTDILSIAREGGADILVATLFESEVEQTEGKEEAARIDTRIDYSLWSVDNSSLLGRGQLLIDNQGREKELDYPSLLFRAGKEVADALLKIMAKKISLLESGCHPAAVCPEKKSGIFEGVAG